MITERYDGSITRRDDLIAEDVERHVREDLADPTVKSIFIFDGKQYPNNRAGRRQRDHDYPSRPKAKANRRQRQRELVGPTVGRWTP